MSQADFNQKAIALEQAFFGMADEQLVLAVHQQFVLSDSHALANVAGLSDIKVMEELQRAEITPKTLMAFSLFPAIHVAWADGRVAEKEKQAILRSAELLGIATGTPAFELLQSWLGCEPSAELFAAWSGFVQAARTTITDSVFQELQSAATKRAQATANAAGGLLGFRSISATERSAIKEIESTFSAGAS